MEVIDLVGDQARDTEFEDDDLGSSRRRRAVATHPSSARGGSSRSWPTPARARGAWRRAVRRRGGHTGGTRLLGRRRRGSGGGRQRSSRCAPGRGRGGDRTRRCLRRLGDAPSPGRRRRVRLRESCRLGLGRQLLRQRHARGGHSDARSPGQASRSRRSSGLRNTFDLPGPSTKMRPSHGATRAVYGGVTRSHQQNERAPRHHRVMVSGRSSLTGSAGPVRMLLGGRVSRTGRCRGLRWPGARQGCLRGTRGGR